MTSVPIRREETQTHRHRREDHHVTMEANIEVLQLSAKECQGL